ncbi:MAG TPA: fatty acyl-AMP ligase [Thermoanaerobaculia bacterium]
MSDLDKNMRDLERATVVDRLEELARTRAGDTAFVFVKDRKLNDETLTYGELHARAAAVAGALAERGCRPGERVLLVYPSGLAYVAAFFGCLLAGAIAVPVYPPASEQHLGRLRKVIEDCRPRVVLTDTSECLRLARLFEEMPGPVGGVCCTDDLPCVDEPVRAGAVAQSADIALLQYTSGSTGNPKGVVITHGNLSANQRLISRAFRGDTPGTVMGWLPLYHDMGLIGFVVAPLCSGISVIFIPTLRFLRDPTTWMDTIHRHRASISFGPNFAYGFVARRATSEQLAGWDLSCLKVLGCGGEPVHPETIHAFSQRFAGHARMAPDLVRPGYGCAEGTLTTSLTPMNEGLRLNVVDAATYRAEGVVAPPREGQPTLTHVACGVPIPGHEVVVVDKAGRRLAEGLEGEILMNGPSVSPGYFRNEKGSRETFRDGWLHTGDLGYLLDGHIYVTGRIKDLIIYHGRNYHPQSIEWPVGSLPGVRKGNVVAFSVPGEDSEELVLVLEAAADDEERLVREIKRVVQAETGLAPRDVVLLGRNRLPKTSSGKLQRRKTREMYLNDELGQAGSRMTAARTRLLDLSRQVARSLWARLRIGAG